MSIEFLLGMAVAVLTNSLVVVGAAWRLTINNERRFTRLETLLETRK